MREHTFNIRLSDVEWTRLCAVAAEFGVSTSETIRLLVKREHDALVHAHAVSLKKLNRKR